MLHDLIDDFVVADNLIRLSDFTLAIIRDDKEKVAAYKQQVQLIERAHPGQGRALAKRVMAEAAQQLNIPALVLTLIAEDLELFRLIYASHTPEERLSLSNLALTYQTPTKGNILFASLYAENKEVTAYVFDWLGKIKAAKALGVIKDNQQQNLVSHAILSGNFAKQFSKIEVFLGAEEFRTQIGELSPLAIQRLQEQNLDKISVKEIVALYRYGSEALRAILLPHISAMKVNGFRVDQIFTVRGIEHFIQNFEQFPPSLENLNRNANEFQLNDDNRGVFFTPEANRFLTEVVLPAEPENIDYYATLYEVVDFDSTRDLLEWLLQSTEFQKVAANNNNQLLNDLIAQVGLGTLEAIQVLLQVDSVKSTVATNNNKILRDAIVAGQFDLVIAMTEIPSVANNLDVALLRADNDVEISQEIKEYLLNFKSIKWFGLPLQQLFINGTYELVCAELIHNTAVMLTRMRDLSNFIQSFTHAPFTKVNEEIMKIKAAHEAVKVTQAADGDNRESAMGHRALVVAELGFAKAQEIYGAGFARQGLVNIERDIRAMILDEILAGWPQPDTEEAYLQRHFLETNRDALINGSNRALMDQARMYFGSNKLENHIAWRAYDRFAPVESHRNPMLIHVRAAILQSIMMEPTLSLEIQNFFQNNRNSLRAGNVQALMNQARAYLNTDSTLHIAWRAVDEFAQPAARGEAAVRVIRERILTEILAAENTPARREFIQNNRAQLIQGNNEALMDQARDHFNDIDTVHIAWRACDPFALRETREQPVWSNLLTERTQSGIDCRTRAAHYYLGLTDPAMQALSVMSIEDRRRVFIGTVAEIRRAHNEDKPDSVDNPSCAPGTRGRIAKMGAGHTELQIVDPVELIPSIIQRILNERLGARLQAASEEEKAEFSLTLEFLSEFNIPAIVSQTDKSYPNVNGEMISVEKLIQRRDEIIALLWGNKDIAYSESLFAEVNADLATRTAPPVRALTRTEIPFILRSAYDLCYGGVGQTLAKAFRPEVPDDREDMEMVNIADPYGLARRRVKIQDIEGRAALTPKQKERMLENDVKHIRVSEPKVIYFNQVHLNLMNDAHLREISQEVIAFITKRIVQHAFDNANEDTSEPQFDARAFRNSYNDYRNTLQFEPIPRFETEVDALADAFDRMRLSARSASSNTSGSNYAASSNGMSWARLG